MFSIPSDDSKTQLVIELCCGGGPLGEQLRVRRIKVLTSTDKLCDGKSLAEHGTDYAIDFLFDEVKQIAVAHWKAEEQLPTCKMVNYLHGLQDRAGRDLTLSAPTRGHQQVFNRCLFEWLGNTELKVPPQVLNGLLAYVIDEMCVSSLVEMQLVIANELACLLYIFKVQSVPIKHRTAAQDEANGFEVMKSKVVNGLQPLPAMGGWWWCAGMPCISVDWRSQLPEFVLVTSSGVRRRSDRVPKKIPKVNPRTVN